MNEVSWAVIAFLLGFIHAWGLAWFLEKRMTALFQRTTFNISNPGRPVKEGEEPEGGGQDEEPGTWGSGPPFIPPKPETPAPFFQMTDQEDEDEEEN